MYVYGVCVSFHTAIEIFRWPKLTDMLLWLTWLYSYFVLFDFISFCVIISFRKLCFYSVRLIQTHDVYLSLLIKYYLLNKVIKALLRQTWSQVICVADEPNNVKIITRLWAAHAYLVGELFVLPDSALMSYTVNSWCFSVTASDT